MRWQGRPITLITAVLCTIPAWGQSSQREPQIGYIYPAGGRQGTTFHVTVGGQFLHGASDAYVSGEGVTARVIKQYRPLRSISPEQRELLAERIRTVFEVRWRELAKAGHVDGDPPFRTLGRFGRKPRKKKSDEATGAKVTLPEHPLFHDLDNKSIRELLHAINMVRSLRKGQRNTQLESTALIEIKIDSKAEPGAREFRLGTRLGLTNPMVFEVGVLKETRELEHDDAPILKTLPREPPIKLPIILNGQIMPGDVDRFRFRAKAGQRLLIDAHARRLIPYLADAVPGWFQATLSLYDADGNELAFVDDYRFSPDPVLCYEVPADGEYELEIRDSIYRGREDFVYRITVGEWPFITSIFPLGCRTGQRKYVAANGWNLRSDRLFLDGSKDDGGVRQKPLGRGRGSSNPVRYEVNPLRSCEETEGNDDIADAQRVRRRTVIDGRINQPGDLDYYRFKGSAGDEIVVEVKARRLCSPMDSLVRLMDAGENVLAWNDDFEHKDGFLHTDMGVLTHHADSYLRTELPADGDYYVQVSDTQGQGGDACAYRLRISPPMPDFELRVTPSSVNVRAGFSTPLRVHVLRKDGFDGEIELELHDAPSGFTLSGGRIPPGRDSVRVTLNAPTQRVKKPVSLTIDGHATVDGERITRTAAPAEDMMQAFLYRHLTPSQEMVVAVQGGGRRGGRRVEVVNPGPIRISPGTPETVRIMSPQHPLMAEVELVLHQPPEGITVDNVAEAPRGLEFDLLAESGVVPVGFADNLIVEAFVEVERGGPSDAANPRKQRISLGVLPAIPIEIVRQ